MPTHISFNGREYAGPEAMPADVRKAYQELLGAGNVLGVVQTSVTYDGRTLDGVPGLPAPMRRLIENAIGRVNSRGTAPNELPGNEPPLQTMDPAGRALGGMLGVVLAFVAGFTIMFSLGLMFAIGGGRTNLASRLAVAIAALLVLGGLDTQATRLARRRESLLGPDSAGYRRFVVWSAIGLFGSAVLLLGLAWFLP